MTASLFLFAPIASAAPAGSGPSNPATVTTCGAVGNGPSFPAYDPVSHDLYVPNQISGNVSIVGPNCVSVGSVALGSTADPIAAAFNPQNDHIYVSGFNSNKLYVLSGTTLLKTLGGGHFSCPSGVTYDPGDGLILVANYCSNNVAAVQGNRYTSSIPVGIEPQQIAYDPFYNSLLVTNFGSGNVTIISSATYPFGATHSSAAAGDPIGIVFDPVNDLDYVASFATDNITVMDGTGITYANIPVGFGPISVAFSQATLHVYATMRSSGNVYVINAYHVVSKIKLNRSSTPIGIVYDDYNNLVYAAGTGTNVLYEMS